MAFQKLKRKWVETREISPNESYELKRNEQILVTKVLHSISEDPGFPVYKIVIVLQCVEFEDTTR